jgi:glucosamine--fructose-6-phosphate aminotransferase (isomerizing)
MGSSYFTTLALYYQGINIKPEAASTYYNYLSKMVKSKMAVLISQSGRSSEVLWCSRLFDKYIAITNYAKSELASSDSVSRIVELKAGEESYSSTKTYINTLIALYNGHKIDPGIAVDKLVTKMRDYELWGKEAAERLFKIIVDGTYKGFYIIGNGPNLSTAYKGALTMTEMTKYPTIGMSVSSYDHGPKESAKGTAIIVIKSNGPSYRRTSQLFKLVENAGAEVIYLEDDSVPEHLSPITSIVPLFFMTYYLAQNLHVKKAFEVGEKVTEGKKPRKK